MAVFTIAGLTLTEALRRRKILGAALLGAVVVGFSLVLLIMRVRFHYLVATGQWDATRLNSAYLSSRLLITLMALFFIRMLSLLFPVLLAGGAISGEIEQGLLSVILSRPVLRWQILLGKWVGLNAVCAASTIVWTVSLWLSLRLQTGEPLFDILMACPYLTVYSVLACTLTLTLSAVFQRVLGMSIAVVLCIVSWLDGIFNLLGEKFNVPALHSIADIAGLLLPQGYIALRIRAVIDDSTPNPFVEPSLISSNVVQEWGWTHLHFPYLDAVYIAIYILVILLVGILLFHRREIS